MTADNSMSLADLADMCEQEYRRTVGIESSNYAIALAIVALAQEIARLRRPGDNDAQANDEDRAVA